MFRKIADLSLPQECPFCLEKMERQISAPMLGQINFTPYESPKTPGKIISSRSEEKNELARTGSIILEKGMKQDVDRKKKENWAKTVQKVENLVAQTTGELAASGRI